MLFFSDRQKTFLSETQKNKTKKQKNQKGKKKKKQKKRTKIMATAEMTFRFT